MASKKKPARRRAATSTQPRRNPALGTCETAVLRGIEAEVVRVSAQTTDVRTATRWLQIEGVHDAAAREISVRVASSFSNAVPWPRWEDRIMDREALNEALRSKEDHYLGVRVQIDGEPVDTLGVDLPAALALAGHSCAAFGELSLDGAVRPVRGALQRAEALARAGHSTILVPYRNGDEVVWALEQYDVELRAVDSLKEALLFLEGDERAGKDVDRYLGRREIDGGPDLTMADVHGNAEVKRTLHRLARETKPPKAVLLYGHAHAPTTMLARRAPYIMPRMDRWEAIDLLRIRSAAGLAVGELTLRTDRHLRAPHHSTSAAGLVGGGTAPRPGEVTLAQHGVLYLDQLQEFDRTAIRALGRALRKGESVITSRYGDVRFPCDDVWLICSTEEMPQPMPPRSPESVSIWPRGAQAGDPVFSNRLETFIEELGIEIIIPVEVVPSW